MALRFTILGIGCALIIAAAVLAALGRRGDTHALTIGLTLTCVGLA